MNTKPLNDNQQMAALVQLANRQRLLEKQASERIIAKAVREALKS